MSEFSSGLYSSGLYVRPLFGDAISGEFVPSCDAQMRKHTLGKLMYAAVDKGEHAINDIAYPHYSVFRYQPSWAPNTRVKIECGHVEGAELLVLAGGIHLADAVGRTLYINDENYDGPQNVHIETPDAEVRLPLALGEPLQVARQAVTAELQKFFDLAHTEA